MLTALAISVRGMRRGIFLVLGNASLEHAKQELANLHLEITRLNIPNEKSPPKKYLTVSTGLASMIPDINGNQNTLIGEAGRMLYKAKEKGRNNIAS